MNLSLSLYPLDFGDLHKFFYKFAKVKFIAEQSRLIQERGLWITPWIVTSNTETQFNFSDPAVQNEIKAEMEEISHRFFRVINRCKPPRNPVYEAHVWLENQKNLMVQFQQNISTRLNEYVKQTNDANKLITVGIISSSVAKLAAEAAMILAGLGIGTATLEAEGLLTLVGQSRTLTQISSFKGFLALFGVGMGKSYSCSFAEGWSASKSADLWFTIRSDSTKNTLQNFPSFVNDVYSNNLKRLESTNTKNVETLKNVMEPPPPVPIHTAKSVGKSRLPRGFKMNKPPWENPNWAKPNAKNLRVQNQVKPTVTTAPTQPVPSTLQPTAAPKPKVSTAQNALKGTVYLMALWSASDALKEFKKHAIDMEL